MIIDFTAELAPFLWGMLALLLILGGAILASIESELAEVYLGDRRLLVATVALAALVLGALIAVRPEIASGIAIPFR
jgi:hypothetical protein